MNYFYNGPENNHYDSYHLVNQQEGQFPDTQLDDQYNFSKVHFLKGLEIDNSVSIDFSQQQQREQLYNKYTIIIPNHDIQPKLPGETKNLPKGFGRQLQNFIKELYKNTKDDNLKELLKSTEVQEFLQFKSENFGKNKLEEFINSKPGQLITTEFFGNCRWIYGMAKDNKAKLDPYFKYNTEYYKEAQIAKKRKLY